MPLVTLADQLTTQGYCLVPGVLSAADVMRTRATLDQIFADPNSARAGDITEHAQLGSVRIDVFNRHPALQWMIVHPPIVQALRTLLGDDFVVVPETAAHSAGYGRWHKDTTSQERAGETFHRAPDFAMVQVALYLQDNDIWGGGIDVRPGSHRQPDRFINATDKTVFDKLRTKAQEWGVLPTPPGVAVPNRAGDLVIFDMRLDHKASWPSRRGIPPVRKQALFWIASRNNAHARSYLRYIQTRADYTYLQGYAYEPQLAALCQQHHVNLLEVAS